MTDEKHRQPLVLALVAVGKSPTERYLIMDQDERYWTGNGWSKYQSEAMRFYDIPDATEAFERLMVASHADQPVRRYVAPVYIDVFSDNPLTEEELAAWLKRAMKLTFDVAKHGEGPADGSLVLPRIEWGEMVSSPVQKEEGT